MPPIEGLHHVTAIAGEPQQNIDFYTGVLGLRLVKLTVNFDDPTTYHLYYGDGQGHPGTILTFFPWPGAYQGRIGTGQLTVTSFAVPEKSLPFWRERLRKRGIEFESSQSDFGEEILFLKDPDGLQIELVSTANADPDLVWERGANIAASLMLLHPHYLAAGALFRPQVPFTPDLIRNYGALSVFIAAGIRDPIVPRDQTEQLAALLEAGGADVSMFWHRGGHELGDDDIAAAKTWFTQTVTKRLAA